MPTLDAVPLLSIVVPCYNESESLSRFYDALTQAGAAWEVRLEIILVDDGSVDGTWTAMKALHDQDPRWRLLRLSRNFGHQTAVSAGLYHANGDAVVVMDADLQDPPAVVGQFIAAWVEGADVVYGVRRARKEHGLKRRAYRSFYRLLTRLARHPIPLDSGDFCLMDRRVVDVLNQTPEKKIASSVASVPERGFGRWAFRMSGQPSTRAVPSIP